MSNLVTLLTFNFQHELAVVRGHLESEGIECFVQDELINQIQPFYANAVGGIKLQVKDSDFDLAMEIVKEAGYIEEAKPISSSIATKIDTITAKIPFLKELQFEIRLIVFIGILISIIVCLAFLII
jgi:hypothetical protein